jgi:AcrR family transcriptional regulator
MKSLSAAKVVEELLVVTKNQHSLSEQQWLEQALQVLSDKGPEYLSLRRLTNILGVTTGSFYWHFKNRREFLLRLVEFWGESSTTAVATKVKSLDGTAEQRLYELMLYIFDHDATRYDATMRAWAMREPELAIPVARVEKFRLEFIRKLFREMGFKGQELLTRAHLCLAYMSAHRIILDGVSLQQRRRQLKSALELLTEKPGD